MSQGPLHGASGRRQPQTWPGPAGGAGLARPPGAAAAFWKRMGCAELPPGCLGSPSPHWSFGFSVCQSGLPGTGLERAGGLARSTCSETRAPLVTVPSWTPRSLQMRVLPLMGLRMCHLLCLGAAGEQTWAGFGAAESPEPGAKARGAQGREDGPDSSAPTGDAGTQHSTPLKCDSFVPGMSQTL